MRELLERAVRALSGLEQSAAGATQSWNSNRVTSQGVADPTFAAAAGMVEPSAHLAHLRRLEQIVKGGALEVWCRNVEDELEREEKRPASEDTYEMLRYRVLNEHVGRRDYSVAEREGCEVRTVWEIRGLAKVSKRNGHQLRQGKG